MNGEQFEKIRRRIPLEDGDAERANKGKRKREFQRWINRGATVKKKGKHKSIKMAKVPKATRRLLDGDS